MDKLIVSTKIYLKTYIKYPMGLFLKLIYIPIQMLLYFFLWKNFIGSDKDAFVSIVLYYLLSLLLSYAFPFVHIANDVQSDVMEGNLPNYLVKPAPYWLVIASKYIAWMMCYSLVYIPVILLVFVSIDISIMNLITFVIHLVIGSITEFLIWYNVGLSAFCIEKTRGISMIVSIGRAFSSGSLLPLYFFPDQIYRIVNILPFKLYIYVPISSLIYGEYRSDLCMNVCLGMVWIMVLAGLSVLFWNMGMKKMQVNIS